MFADNTDKNNQLLYYFVRDFCLQAPNNEIILILTPAFKYAWYMNASLSLSLMIIIYFLILFLISFFWKIFFLSVEWKINKKKRFFSLSSSYQFTFLSYNFSNIWKCKEKKLFIHFLFQLILRLITFQIIIIIIF